MNHNRPGNPLGHNREGWEMGGQVKKSQANLHSMAIALANRLGDSWNAMLFQNMNPKRLTTAERELLANYIATRGK